MVTMYLSFAHREPDASRIIVKQNIYYKIFRMFVSYCKRLVSLNHALITH